MIDSDNKTPRSMGGGSSKSGASACLRSALPRILPLLAMVVLGCASRPAAPPPGVQVSVPFGAIDVDERNFETTSEFQESLRRSIAEESPRAFDSDGDGVRTYSLLALSGGGSKGAFGAGLLCGWTESGTRPDFKVVSGVSTGALQATFAFLGREYDHVLREVYTAYDSSGIYRKRSLWTTLVSDALHDTWPLKELIDQYITEDVLAEVALRHSRGYRLFVGTTNLDTSQFIVWDLGRIAASGRPDALEHYRRVLLASAAIPVLFPPVYFEVEAGGESYSEMHVDGGTFAQLFFRGYMLEFDDAVEEAGVGGSHVELYIIRNGKADDLDERAAIPGRLTSIASETIKTLFKLSGTSALYRVYVLARRNGIDFHLAAIPSDFTPEFEATDFDEEAMRALFDLAYRAARDGYDWLSAPPFLDPDERFEEP